MLLLLLLVEVLEVLRVQLLDVRRVRRLDAVQAVPVEPLEERVVLDLAGAAVAAQPIVDVAQQALDEVARVQRQRHLVRKRRWCRQCTILRQVVMGSSE